MAGKPAPKPKLAIVKPEAIVVDLPEEASVPSHDLNDYHILIHGEKKIGKTTLATMGDGKVFVMTFDPIRKALPIIQRFMPDWATFAAYLKELEKRAKSGKFPYDRIVIDGADIWYRYCQKWVEKKLVVDHISEEKWGRGWDMLKETFQQAVIGIMNLPCGVWFISHSAWKEVETREPGRKIEKLVPLIKAGGEEILNGRVDAWFAYDYSGKDRILIVRGDERTGAGCGIKGHFLTPKGRQVVEVPMGGSEEEAWKNLVHAFENKQTFITVAESKLQAAKKGGVPGKK